MSAKPPYPGWVLVNRDSSPYHTSGIYRWVPPDDPAVTGERKEGHVGISASWCLEATSNESSTKQGIQPITFAKTTRHEKGWGEEVWVASNDKYCGKILRFKAGKKMSFHSHDIKSESWLITQGKLKMTWFDLLNADKHEKILSPMDVVHIPRGNPHQLEALEDSEVFEVSDADRSWDNYRIGKGDSQK